MMQQQLGFDTANMLESRASQRAVGDVDAGNVLVHVHSSAPDKARPYAPMHFAA
jgi:hypothetical protein